MEPSVSVALLAVVTGPIGAFGATIWGALWGSFYNVVIARVPEGESVAFPASHCRSCKAALSWYDNIPIVSYLVLGGKCRHCKQGYSSRYMLVEALVALLAFFVWWAYVKNGSGEAGIRVARFVICAFFCGLMVVLSFIDLDTFMLPDKLTLPGIAIFTGCSFFMPLPRLYDGLIGAAGGYLLIRGISDGWKLLRGRYGMGYGDGKLMAIIGGLLGWQVVLPTLFLASLHGTVIMLPLLILRRGETPHARKSLLSDDEEGDDDANDGEATEDSEDEGGVGQLEVPFGPFIAIAGIELMLGLPAFLKMFEDMFRV